MTASLPKNIRSNPHFSKNTEVYGLLDRAFDTIHSYNQKQTILK